MNATAYQLDPNMAKEGSEGVGFSRINTSGAYTGMITKAKHITAKTGTEGIELSFECISGASADYITVYTKKPDGTILSGTKLIHALMACLEVRAINPILGMAEEYDQASNGRKQVQVMLFPELMNKPIGLVLQAEEYQPENSAAIKNRMILFAPFKAETQQTALEVLNQQPALSLEKMIPTVKDKKLAPQRQAATEYPNQAPDSNFDDSGDISF